MRLRKAFLLLLLVLVLALLALLAAGSGPGLRWLTGLPWSGSLWAGLQLEAASGQQGAWRWQVRDLHIDAPWRTQGAWQLRVRAAQLDLQRHGPATPPPGLVEIQAQLLQLAGAPDLSLDLGVDRLRVNGQPVEALHLLLDSRTAGLRASRLQLQWQGSTLQAEGTLSPLAVLALRLDARREALQLQGTAAGRLDQLLLKAQLDEGATRWLDLDAQLDALAAQPLRQLDARWQALDPQRLHAQAPAGRWQGSAKLVPEGSGAGERLRVDLDTQNADARRLDQDGWPLRRLQLQAALDPAQWQSLALQSLTLELGSAQQPAGRVALAAPQTLSAASAPLQTTLQTALLLRGLQPQGLRADWPALPIDGRLALTREAQPDAPLRWQVQLASPGTTWRAQGQGELQGRRLLVREAQWADGAARLLVRGEAEQTARGWRSEGAAEATALRVPLPPWPQASLLSGRLDWRWAQQDDAHTGELQLALLDGSRWAGVPLSGQARWAPTATQAPWALQLQGSGVELAAQGDLGGPLHLPQDLPALRRAERFQPQQLRWRVDDLAALAPLWQPWLKDLAGRSQGEWAAANRQLRAEVERLRVQAPGQPAVRVQRAALRWLGDDGDLTLQGLERDALRVQQAQLEGGLARALQWQAEGSWLAPPAAPRAWRGSGRSGAPVRGDDGRWRWPAVQAQLGPAQGAPWLQLSSPELLWQGEAAQLAPGTLTLAGEALALQALRWQAGQWLLQLDGRARLQPWLALLDTGGEAAGWQGDASAQVRFSARQDDGDAQPRLALQLDGLRGALQLDGQPLDLQALQLQLNQQGDGSGSLAARLNSRLLGAVDADLRVDAGRDGRVEGQVRAQLPRLAGLRPWLPLGLLLEGNAQLDAQLGGTRAMPQLRGSAALQLDRLQHAASGFAAQDGRLQAAFDAQQLRITQLSLRGAGENGGRLSGEGSVDWQEGAARARLALQLEQLRVLTRFDRKLVLSGQGRLQLDPQRLQLDGRLRADEGFFEVGRPDAPELDEDVRVAGGAPREATAPLARRWPREVDVQLDLGERLRVQGRGFASRLTGQLQLLESGGKPWQLIGRIETQGGRYKAYGQTLDIESGELRFTGAPTNPRLALLAVKPDIEHRVGVSVTGSLEQPRVRLFAEPELSDNDKLAWLLLGRDPKDLPARDTALLQRAALAVLAGEGESTVGQFMDRLGLTEFSVSQGEDAGTVLRLGAQLSRRWSLGYERSLNATSGSWQLVYRLGQRFRLRAQSGTESALDGLWLWRFD